MVFIDVEFIMGHTLGNVGNGRQYSVAVSIYNLEQCDNHGQALPTDRVLFLFYFANSSHGQQPCPPAMTITILTTYTHDPLTSRCK
jgi:hypothetical protein